VRHYIPKTKNADYIPHNLYMQMLYVIRDFCDKKTKVTCQRERQFKAVSQVIGQLKMEYDRGSCAYGPLNPLQAFFEYPYYSMMFAQRTKETGASKRSWGMYRCRFARLTAHELGLL